MGSRFLVWAMMFFLIPSVTMGQEHSSALVDTLLFKSDLDHLAGQLTKSVQAGFEHSLSTHTRLKVMPQAKITKLRAALKISFSPEGFKNGIRTTFREKLSVEDIKEVLSWLDSDTGKKIAQLEAAASKPEHYDGMQHFQARLQTTPPLPERLRRIQSMESALKATAISVDVALKTQLAVAMVLVAHLPEGGGTTTEALAAAIEKNSRGLIEEAIGQETHLFFLYTYDSLSIAEINRYTAFASSPAGARYHDAIASGVKTALTEGCDQWRQMIAPILNP